MFEFSADDNGVALELLLLTSVKRLFRVLEWVAHRRYGGTRDITTVSVAEFDSLAVAYEQFSAIAAKVFILSNPAFCQEEELLRLGGRHAKLTEEAILKLIAERDAIDGPA